MPTFEVRSPDGNTYEIDGPEGATEQDAIRMVQHQLSANRPSTAGAFFRGIERGALPAVAGMAGFGAGEIAGPIGGIAAGFGAAAGTEALQEKFLESHPNVAKFLGQDPETRAADVAAHPWAGRIGEIAPNVSPVGMMRTSFAAFKSLPKETKALLESAASKAPEELTAAEKGALEEAKDLKKTRLDALKTSAMGAGLMAGIDTGQQLIGDQSFDFSSLGESAAIGALGTKETKLGKRIREFGGSLVGRKPPEIVPPAAESATPSSTETPDEMGESAPAAGGPTEPAPAPTTKLGDILGEQAAAAYPEPKPPVPAPEAVEKPSKVATVAQPIELPEPKAPSPVVTNEEGVAELGDFVPEEKPADRKADALEYVQTSGNTSAVGIQKALGIKLSEAKEVRQSLIDDGTLVKVKGKYVLAPKEAPNVRPETAPAAQPVLPDNLGGKPPAGAKPPVPLNPAERAGAVGPVGAGLGDVNGRAGESHGGAQELSAPLVEETDAQKEALVDRIVRARVKGDITDEDVLNFKQELNGADPSYAHIGQLLDILTKPKSKEDFFKQVRSRTAAKRIAAMRKPKAEPAPKTPETDADQRAINEYLKKNPEPVSAPTKRSRDTASGDVNKRVGKLAVPEGWTKDDYDAAVNEFVDQHPELKVSDFPEWDGVSKLNDLPQPMTTEAVQKVVNDTMLHWRGSRPNVVVHRTVDTLHPALRDTVGDTNIHGIHHEQLGVHLIAKNLYTPEEVRGTLFHELLGHRGLTNLFGAEKDRVMRDIYKTNPEMRRYADTWKATFGKSEYYKNYTPEELTARAVEETFARRSEGEVVQKSFGFRAALRRMISWIKDFARQKLGLKYTDNDVMQIMRQAHESVTTKDMRSFLHRTESRNEQPALSEGSNFKRWFGKSRVVDTNGMPLTLYHGTSRDTPFKGFNVNRNGTWFTTDPKEASQYAHINDTGTVFSDYDPYTGGWKIKNTAERVIPVHLRIENPYKMTEADFAQYKNVVDYRKWQRNFFDTLRMKGYDGVDMGGGTWVVLKDPTQIKSSIGNSGAYGNVKDIALNAVAPKVTKKAEPAKERTFEELKGKKLGELEKLAPNKSIVTRFKDVIHGIINTDYEENVRKFENERRPWVHFERNLGPLLNRKGLLDDYNDVASRMDAAGALGKNAMINQMNPQLKALHEAINEYAASKGINVKEALAELNLYRTALHEPERRKLLFAMEAPLSTILKYMLPNGKKVIAADLRKDLILHLHQNTPYNDMDVARMRKILDDLVDPKNGFLDAAGYSKSGQKSIDVNDLKAYKVAGTYTLGELQMLRDLHDKDMKNPKVGAKIEKVWKSLKDVQDKTIELNKKARYWSTPVDNLVKFYGYKHYVPFKGDPNASANRYDYADSRLSGVHTEFERAAEGRESDSENTLLQSMSDAARSAARLGRADIGTAVSNLIRQGLIKEAAKPKHISFADRYSDADIEDMVKGQNKFVKYNSDGSFVIHTIHPRDMHLLRALKGEIQDREGFLRKVADLMRPVTSTMGKMHTLLNVSFAPYNYARHLITNSLAISSQYGVGKIPQLFANAAVNTVTGKMGTAMRMYNQLAYKGDFAALEKMAGKSAFARNLYEYLKNGGDTTMMDALQHKAIMEQMTEGAKRVNGNLIHATTDKLGQMFQLWAHGFELTNRATMYGVVKGEALKELAAKGIKGEELEAQAQSYASNYTKNLLNFQNVGTYGRDLSSVFMFYRAASTGAVRALDALRPAWVTFEQHLKSLPENLKLTPEMIEQQRTAFNKLKTNARMTAMFMFGTGFGVHQIARMMAGDDEQGRNIVATDNMDQWQRNMRFPAAFLGAGNNNAFIQFPWGYGIGSLGSVGAQVSGYLEGHTPFKDLLWNILNPLRESFFPVPTANFNPATDATTALKWVVDSATPSMFRPLVEAAMNIDTFGKEVTSTHISKYGDVYSAGESVPSLYRDTAEYILEHTGMQIDPSTIQFVVNNYADGAARLAQNFHADMQSVEGQDNWDPKRSLAAMPVSNFIGKRTSIDAKEFADVEREVVKMRDVVNMFASTGRVDQLRNYVADHPEAMPLIQLYNSDVNGSIKKYRQMINLVEANAQLTPKQKHDYLVDLKAGRDMSMRGFIDIYHQFNR